MFSSFMATSLTLNSSFPLQSSSSQQQRLLPPLQQVCRLCVAMIWKTQLTVKVIKLDLENNSDRRTKVENEWDWQPAFIDCGSSSTLPAAVSSTQPVGASMPTLSSNFEDLSFRPYNNDMLSGSGGWGSTSHCQNASGPYNPTASSSQGYYSRPAAIGNGRNPQNLPSLTEMNLAQTATGYNSRSSQIPRQHPSTSYYCSSPTDPLEMSYQKAAQTAYPPSIYSQTPRTPYTISMTDYGSSMYEPCCYPNGNSWPPSIPCSGSGYVGSDTASVHSMGRRRRGNLPKHVTDVLRTWFHEHLDHPYPTDEDKQMLIAKTQLTMSQVSLLLVLSSHMTKD